MDMKDMTNLQYHANRTHLSSSLLKVLLKDPQEFYRQWVLGEKNEEYNPAFVEGSLTHTLCLEPEKLGDYAVYPGSVRRGKEFEAFKLANPGKELVTATQLEKAKLYARACFANPVAVHLLSGGQEEFAISANILETPMKMRADYINLDKDYIVDIKTTSRPSEMGLFKNSIIDYGYDLSAALYCGIAREVYDRTFDFYWIVISKSDLGCEVYKASSSTLTNGRILVRRAVKLFNKCTLTNEWKMHDIASGLKQPEIAEV